VAEDLDANTNVDCNCDHRVDPDGAVVRVNTNVRILAVDPAPDLKVVRARVLRRSVTYSRVSINIAMFLIPIEQAHQGGNQRESIADRRVPFEHILYLSMGPAAEHDEVDIDCHTGSKQRVSLHEPMMRD
jgi:hypothetical protein